MLGPTPLRDTYLVAGFELREMLRSRRAFMVLGLYLAIAAVATYVFVQFLAQLQTVVANPATLMGPPPNARAGTTPTAPEAPAQAAVVTPAAPRQDALYGRRSPFRGMVRNMMSTPELADFLLNLPPISLFYFTTSLLMVPFLIMITASETVAQEHQSRGVRFIALRTGRVEFVLGKVLGQGLLMALVTLCSGGMGMAIAAWKLQDFDFMAALDGTLLFWPRLVAYCVPFLGLAALASMNSSSVVSARVFSLGGLVAMWVGHQFARSYADTPYETLGNFIDHLTPYFYQNDLLYPSYQQVGAAAAALVGLGALYIAVGLIFYRRRDL